MAMEIVMQQLMLRPVFGDTISVLEKQLPLLRHKLVEFQRCELAIYLKDNPLCFDQTLITKAIEDIDSLNIGDVMLNINPVQVSILK